MCGKTSLGPLRDGEQKFCSRDCLRGARSLEYPGRLPARSDPSARVGDARALLSGCGREGIDRGDAADVFHCVHGVFCWTETKFDLCCAHCSMRNSLQAVIYCALLGWWSLWGLIAPPLRIVKNLHAAFRWRVPENPSPQLMLRARLDLAETRGHGAAFRRSRCRAEPQCRIAITGCSSRVPSGRSTA